MTLTPSQLASIARGLGYDSIELIDGLYICAKSEPIETCDQPSLPELAASCKRALREAGMHVSITFYANGCRVEIWKRNDMYSTELRHFDDADDDAAVCLSFAAYIQGKAK